MPKRKSTQPKSRTISRTNFYRKCAFCPKTYKSIQGLQYHTHIHTRETPYACKSCPLQFRNPKSRFRHECRDHLGYIFPCKLCPPKRFYSTEELAKHTDAVHNTKNRPLCDICGKIYSQPRSLVKHKYTHLTERKFKCIFCPKSFKVKNYWRIHLKTHTGEKGYKCDICQKSFGNSWVLKRHKESTHKTVRDEKCDLCPKSFKTKTAVQSHIKLVHIRKENLINLCHICGYETTSPFFFRAHLLLHSGERPFKCPVQMCPHRFRLKADIPRHLRTHTKEEPFKCYFCNKTFANCPPMYKHIRKWHTMDLF